MRLIFYLPKFLFFSNINVNLFKIVPLGSYTPMETLFPLLVAALEAFNRHGIEHVLYTLLAVFLSPEMTSFEDFLSLGRRKRSQWMRLGEGGLGNHRNSF